MVGKQTAGTRLHTYLINPAIDKHALETQLLHSAGLKDVPRQAHKQAICGAG